MSLIATCPECRKRYKVPHADKTWNCKACAVPLEVNETGPSEGESQAEEDARENDSLDQDRGIQRIRTQAKVLMRNFKSVRVLLFLTMLNPAIKLLMALIAVAKGNMAAVPELPAVVAQLIVLTLTIAAFLACRTVHGRAFPFLIILLVLQTFGTIEMFVATSGSFSIGRLLLIALPAAITLIYAFGTMTSLKLSRLQREHPEAFAEWDESVKTQRTSRAKRTPREKSTRSAPRSGRLASQGSGGNFGWIFGCILTAIYFGVQGYSYLNRPDTPDGIVLEFQEAWNSGDFNAVAGFAAVDRRQRWVQRLERQDEKRSWNGTPPTLETGVFPATESTSIWVRYPVEAGELRAQFSRGKKEWILKSLDYRDLPD